MKKHLIALFLLAFSFSLNSCKDSNGVESNKIETPDPLENSLYFTIGSEGGFKLYKCQNGKISIFQNNGVMYQTPIGDKLVYCVFSQIDTSLSLFTSNTDHSNPQLKYKTEPDFSGILLLSNDMNSVYHTKHINYRAPSGIDYDTVCVMKYNLADKTEKRIIKEISRETMMEQSPDGSKLAYFTATDLVRGELHICDANGGSDIVLGSNFGDHHDLYYHLVWSRDGKYLTTTNYEKTKFAVFSSDGTLVNTYDLEARDAAKQPIDYSSSIQIPGTGFAYSAHDHNGNISIYKSNLSTPWHVEKSATDEIFTFPCFDDSAQRLAWISYAKDGRSHIRIMKLSDLSMTSSDNFNFVKNVSGDGNDSYIFPRLFWSK